MALNIKQQVFSWRSRFFIQDDNGVDRYLVEGKIWSFGRKLFVYDMAGATRLYLEQVVMSMMPRYDIYIDGQAVCQVHMRPRLFNSYYEIYGLNWSVEGDFFAHEYIIREGDYTIATISKKWFTWGDTYHLECANPNNELAVLGVVLAIDSAQHESD